MNSINEALCFGVPMVAIFDENDSIKDDPNKLFSKLIKLSFLSFTHFTYSFSSYFAIKGRLVTCISRAMHKNTLTSMLFLDNINLKRRIKAKAILKLMIIKFILIFQQERN